MEDARQLIELTKALTNRRKRRMRAELREAFGEAMSVPRRHRDELDCVESDQAFVVLKPEGSMTRERFEADALRPLLRQAVVAIAAAVETYVADRACGMVGPALRGLQLPKRLREMAITLGDVKDVEAAYERRNWGYRAIVETTLRKQASAAPNQVGIVFSTVGVDELWKRVDAQRKVKKGTSHGELSALAERRNLIAHSADWSGRGRASLSSAEVDTFFDTSYEIVEAIERVVEG